MLWMRVVDGVEYKMTINRMGRRGQSQLRSELAITQPDMSLPEVLASILLVLHSTTQQRIMDSQQLQSFLAAFRAAGGWVHASFDLDNFADMGGGAKALKEIPVCDHRPPMRSIATVCS